MGKTTKIGLSKNLLQMKFMQRCKVKYEDKPIEPKDSIDTNPNECAKIDNNQYLMDSSFETFENLKFGRMSFKGMNVEIERLVSEKYSDKVRENNQDEDEERPDEVDITKRKMIKRYSKYVYNYDIDGHSNGSRKRFKKYRRPVD
jgi:hypothetical protein